MSGPVMETRNARFTGAFIAECPVCHTVCAYWDDEDLDDDGLLHCSDCVDEELLQEE